MARSVDVKHFGAFALAFSIYSLVISISSSLVGQILVVRYSAASKSEFHRGVDAAVGSCALLTMAVLVVLAPVSPWVSPTVLTALSCLGVYLPGLILQDLVRTAFIARGTPHEALINDAMWFAVQFTVIGFLAVAGIHSLPWLMTAWGGAACIAAAAGLFRLRARVRLRASIQWMVQHRDIGMPSVSASLATLGAAQLSFVLIAATGGIRGVGAIRAAQTMLGPLNIVGAASSSFAVPELVRRRPGNRSLVLAAAVLSLILIVVDAGWGILLLLLPRAWGTFLLGDTWSLAAQSLPAMVLFTCAIGGTVGASAVARAMGRQREALFMSLVLTPGLLVLPVVGSQVSPVRGAAVGFACAAILAVPPTWWLFGRTVRTGWRHSTAVEEGAAPVDGSASH